MIFIASPLRRTLWLVAGSCLSLAAFGETASEIAPVPPDPLELVTGPVLTAASPASRKAALDLVAGARKHYALRNAGQGYDLKVAFIANSLGQTNYDGAWEMEDQFAPGQGLRWTAKAATGYNITSIAVKGGTYAEGTASTVPLRLHEARGILLDPLPSPAYASRESIRTSVATFNGATVTCVLLSRAGNIANAVTGRGWEESEECIDPQTGLLQVHSEAPGRYAVYNYANAPRLGGHILPRSVTVTEAGRMVSKISVESLQAVSTFDASLFVPTATMTAKGRATTITSASKIWRIQGQGPFTANMAVRPVCVFGLVNSTGQLVEAHSLQPSDPNSEAAVEDAKQIDFSPSIPAGAPPRQHFVFVIEKFVTQQ